MNPEKSSGIPGPAVPECAYESGGRLCSPSAGRLPKMYVSQLFTFIQYFSLYYNIKLAELQERDIILYRYPAEYSESAESTRTDLPYGLALYLSAILLPYLMDLRPLVFFSVPML